MGLGSSVKRPPQNITHPPYATVYKAIGGWQSMVVWWNPAMGGYWEPYESGRGPYAFEAAARREASEWAAEWGIECQLPATPPDPERAPGLIEHLAKYFPDMEIVDL